MSAVVNANMIGVGSDQPAASRPMP